MDRVDSSHGVFITAEGLLMYLEPDEALRLIGDCAARFPGGAMVFDSIPHWLSRRTLTGLKLSDRYVTPPMPFGFSAEEGLALAETVHCVTTARDIALPAGRGLFKVMAWQPLDRIGRLRRIRPSITLLEFGS
jgi:O-methyltransferase involved in polyketide biosynthesis